MSKDEVIERIRKVRHAISEAHDHDPVKLVEYYRRRQQQHKDRIRRDRQPISVDEHQET